MRSTRSGPVGDYLGIDLTDATARRPRPVDVCGLTRRGGRLAAAFWTWTWDGEGIGAAVEELRAARCSMIDGPQALAAGGAALRACERVTAAAGKTPDAIAACRGRPYGGLVATSLDLFAALAAAGLRVSPPGFVGGVGEVYPGYVWRRLAPRLGSKAGAGGRAQRRALLAACGVALGPAPLSHDRLDAALAALVAAAADGRARGLSVRAVGAPLRRRPSGELEEGPIAVLEVEAGLADRLARAASRAARRHVAVATRRRRR